MDRASGLPAHGEALLTVSGLEAWYGESHVLHGIAFDDNGDLLHRMPEKYHDERLPYLVRSLLLQLPEALPR